MIRVFKKFCLLAYFLSILLIFQKEEFQMYSIYCQNKPRSEALRMRVGDSNPFFKECQQRLGHKLPLGAYLLKPVQRITKYQLLLKVLSLISLTTGICRTQHSDTQKIISSIISFCVMCMSLPSSNSSKQLPLTAICTCLFTVKIQISGIHVNSHFLNVWTASMFGSQKQLLDIFHLTDEVNCLMHVVILWSKWFQGVKRCDLDIIDNIKGRWQFDDNIFIKLHNRRCCVSLMMIESWEHSFKRP